MSWVPLVTAVVSGIAFVLLTWWLVALTNKVQWLQEKLDDMMGITLEMQKAMKELLGLKEAD